MDNSEQDEDLLICAKNWEKVSSHILKDGFRDGFECGREKSFQNGFDIGYKESIPVGKVIGVIHFLANELSKSTFIKTEADTEYLRVLKCLKLKCLMCPEKLFQGQKITKEEIAESAARFDNHSLDVVKNEQQHETFKCISTAKERLLRIILAQEPEAAAYLKMSVDLINFPLNEKE